MSFFLVYMTKYALSAFTLGYFWNIMCFDIIALAPLVFIGVISYIKENKCRLYVVTLGLAVFSNFYMGFFLCVFSALLFIGYSFIYNINIRDFFKKALKFGGFSLLALGLSAILILPVIGAIQQSFSSVNNINTFPAYAIWNENFFDIIGNFIAFTEPTSVNGLPNLYSGIISIILLALFLKSDKISINEKVVWLIILIFMVISTSFNMLNYILHGFSYTRGLPSRFSFLISFSLVFMAYKAYVLTKHVKLLDVLFMLSSGLFIIIMAIFGSQEIKPIIFSFILMLIYLGLITFKIKRKSIIIALIIIAELSVSAYIGVNIVGYSTRSTYPPKNNEIQYLLSKRDNIDFYRTELTERQTANSSSLYSYRGISIFSSLVNTHVSNFMGDIGLRDWEGDNSFNYNETSPLINAFLSMKYLINLDGNPADAGTRWEQVSSIDRALLLENKYVLPFGFMTNSNLQYFYVNRVNPIQSQNDLFRLSTGINKNLFTIIDIVNIDLLNYTISYTDIDRYDFILNDDSETGTISFQFKLPRIGCLYIFAETDLSDRLRLYMDDKYIRDVAVEKGNLFHAGSFDEDTIVSISLDASVERGYINIIAVVIDNNLFTQGFDILSSQPLILEIFTDTFIKGHILAETDGLLYTSLPHAGLWRAYINGERAEIITIGGAMAGLMLDKGLYEIEFVFHNQLLNLGIGISFISLLVLFFLCVSFSKKK